MVQKMLITLEIDDSALDAAQAKADKLIATLKEAERLMTPAVPEPSDVCELWQAAFEKGLVDMPPPEQPQAKEKPPEGGNREKHSDEWARRVAVVRALAKRHNVSDIVEDAIQQAAHEMFKPPD